MHSSDNPAGNGLARDVKDPCQVAQTGTFLVSALDLFFLVLDE